MSTADSADVRAAELPRWDHCPICDLLVEAPTTDNGQYSEKVALDSHVHLAHGFWPWPNDNLTACVNMRFLEFRDHTLAEYVRLIMAGEL